MTLALGTKLGPYEILSPIGAGGMGEVWKARDTRLGRIVAIKKVKEQQIQPGAWSYPFSRRRQVVTASPPGMNGFNACVLTASILRAFN